MTISAQTAEFQRVLLQRAWTGTNRLRTPYFLLPCLLFLVHSALFWGWIVDDAGISFAYAKNLIAGEGLVAQPGVEPVEGYSNPAWVALLAPFYALHLFDPVITPKVLSFLLVGFSFWVIFLIMDDYTPEGRHLLRALPLLFLSVNTPFVVWTTSGLENPLLVFLLCLYLYLTLKMTMSTAGRPALLGLIAAAIALTRPDGLIFAPVLPVVLATTLWFGSRSLNEARVAIRQVVAYFGSFGVIFGSFLMFRLLYFGGLYPNTYYAKEGPGSADLIALITFRPSGWTRLDDLLGSVAGGLIEALVLVIVLFLSWRVVSGRRTAEMVVAQFLWASALVVLLLPSDWMGEHRFATAFVVFFYVFATLAGSSILQSTIPGRHGVRLAASLGIILVVASAVQFVPRSVAFSQNPTLSLDVVRERYAERFNNLAETLRVQDGSVLLPDIGGMLLYSDLHVYDLAGLIDETIARSIHDDREGLYDYVFEVAQPTFIHHHSWWTYTIAFDDDLRFRRDYVPICEDVDAWITEVTAEVRYSGYYVRKDAVASGGLLAAARVHC